MAVKCFTSLSPAGDKLRSFGQIKAGFETRIEDFGLLRYSKAMQKLKDFGLLVA